MYGSWLLRAPFLALLVTLNASFTTTEPSVPTAPVRVESSLRVSTHFAAGLEYVLVEPPDLPPDAELPLIVYLHGRGDRPRVPRDRVYDLDTPVRLILPRGPERLGQGYAWAPVSAHRGESPALLAALDARARMLSDAMLEWQRRHPTRGRPIVVGFSQGGILAMTLAVREPGSIARAIPMAGWLPPSLLPPRADRYAVNARVVALHGEDDPVLGAARTAGTVQELVKLGYPVELEIYPGVGHEVSADMRRRLRELLEEAIRELPERRRFAGAV